MLLVLFLIKAKLSIKNVTTSMRKINFFISLQWDQVELINVSWITNSFGKIYLCDQKQNWFFNESLRCIWHFSHSDFFFIYSTIHTWEQMGFGNFPICWYYEKSFAILSHGIENNIKEELTDKCDFTVDNKDIIKGILNDLYIVFISI